jgi:hypothetical protein
MPVEIIKYNNREIIYVDNTGLSGEKIIENTKNANKLAMVKGKNALVLSNFTGANISNDVLDYFKSEETIKASKCCDKQATVGIGGIKKTILNIYNSVSGSTTKLFNTLEEAKEYLVK